MQRHLGRLHRLQGRAQWHRLLDSRDRLHQGGSDLPQGEERALRRESTSPDTGPVRIAMWSGPRNISTAMMRSFENRPDTSVVDEPFYAAFLAATGIDHPMREESLASQSQDWREVVESLLGPVPEGRPVFYQKHMTHHMVPGFGRDWIAE